MQKPLASHSSAPFSPNWFNICFVVPMQIMGLLAIPLYFLSTGTDIHWQEIFVFFLMFALGAIGIDVGYHRGFSHRSFEMSPFLKVLALFGGASAAEGSVLAWCSDHRRHHRYQDTEKDHYNVRRGFWWAHMGWILGSPTSTDFSNCPDLAKDPLIRFQNKTYALWFILSGLGLPLALGFLLGRPLECFLLGGLFRLLFLHHSTYLINSYAHYFGKKPYSKEITARDSLLCALLAQGEGWHNFHHRFPFDYRNGHRFYHYDPTKWFIYFGQFLGLTKSLKRTSACEIYRARIQAQKHSITTPSPLVEKLTEAMEASISGMLLVWLGFKASKKRTLNSWPEKKKFEKS